MGPGIAHTSSPSLLLPPPSGPGHLRPPTESPEVFGSRTDSDSGRWDPVAEGSGDWRSPRPLFPTTTRTGTLGRDIIVSPVLFFWHPWATGWRDGDGQRGRQGSYQEGPGPVSLYILHEPRVESEGRLPSILGRGRSVSSLTPKFRVETVKNRHPGGSLGFYELGIPTSPLTRVVPRTVHHSRGPYRRWWSLVGGRGVPLQSRTSHTRSYDPGLPRRSRDTTLISLLRQGGDGESSDPG